MARTMPLRKLARRDEVSISYGPRRLLAPLGGNVRAGERSERPARTLYSMPRRLLASLGGNVRAGERSERPARTLYSMPRRLLASLGGAAVPQRLVPLAGF